MKLADRLRKWDAFSHFTNAQLASLEGCAAVAKYAEGATVLTEGASGAEAFLIDSGKVRIQRSTPYGHYTLADLGPGDLFGETAFIDQDTRSGDAVALDPTQLLGFDPAALRNLLRDDQRLALAFYWTFWKSLSKKLRRTNFRLEQFFTRSGQSTIPSGPAPPPGGDADFRVDLASKRKLFEEQRLSGLEINFLTSLSQERKLAPDEVLFNEGDPGDDMYVVLEGRIMIYKNIPGGGEEALAFLERGDYFGEMALFDREPRSADAKADEGGAVVLSISREVLSGILDIGKPSSLRLLKLLCSLVAKRLRELDDKLVGWFILAGGGGTETPPPVD